MWRLSRDELLRAWKSLSGSATALPDLGQALSCMPEDFVPPADGRVWYLRENHYGIILPSGRMAVVADWESDSSTSMPDREFRGMVSSARWVVHGDEDPESATPEEMACLAAIYLNDDVQMGLITRNRAGRR